MATFDQLPADQRALIELVLRRRQSYDELAGILGMPASRVRELARDALGDLSPATARRVDDDWRAQVADYVLGQQSGPESRATRGHLRRSEPARTWALSLMDALDGLYANGGQPDIPEAEPRPERTTRPRERRPERAPRPRREERAEREERVAAPLSASAREAVRRRRLGAALGGLVVVAVAVLLWPIGVLTGDDDDGDTGAADAAQEAPRTVGSPIMLEAVGESDGQGFAVLAQQGDDRVLIVQAQGLQPTERPESEEDSGTAYEVWLFDSRRDAVSLGAQLTDEQGNFQGAGPIPDDADIQDFRFIDVSLERIDNTAAHSGRSVLRGEIADLTRPPQQGAGGGGQEGGGGQGDQP